MPFSFDIIRFQQAQIQVLWELIGKDKRLLLSDKRRIRLAEAGKPLGRQKIGEFCSLFTPDTILRWHRRLVARHHTYESKSMGRPSIGQEVIELTIRLAKENACWGADRIAGELKKLGHRVSDTWVENVLKENGIDPQPERKKDGCGWAEFLKAHWECLVATDFTTVDVWTPTGLKTIYLLFVIELKTRQVQFLGSTANPDEAWMLQTVERAPGDDGLLGGDNHPTILLMDRDTKFSKTYQAKLSEHDVKAHVLPPRSPNMNAYIERFMGTFKRELADRMIFFGKGMLDHATEQFLEHYHQERPHQGLGNELIVPLEKPPDPNGKVVVDRRLGGMLKSYRRVA